jgi:hypothetical protein
MGRYIDASADIQSVCVASAIVLQHIDTLSPRKFSGVFFFRVWFPQKFLLV